MVTLSELQAFVTDIQMLLSLEESPTVRVCLIEKVWPFSGPSASEKSALPTTGLEATFC